MSNYTLRLRRKTKYSPQVEGVKLPSEGFAGGFNRQIESDLLKRASLTEAPACSVVQRPLSKQ